MSDDDDDRWIDEQVGLHELANIAWSYPKPLVDAAEIAGLVRFYQERLDLLIDGVAVSGCTPPGRSQHR